MAIENRESPSTTTPRESRFVAALARVMLAARRRSALVLAGAVALAAGGIFLVRSVTFDSDILRLLPKDAASVQSFKRFLQTFGSLDHLYVVFESPDGIGTHTDIVNAYVDALRHTPEIQSVDAQLLEPDRDWAYFSDRVLYLLGPTGAADALARFRSPGLQKEVEHARGLLAMPSDEVKTYVQQDPLGLFALLKTRMESGKGTLTFDPTQEGYVSPDGRSRLVMVKPNGAPFDTDFCKRLFARLDEIETRARASVKTAGGDPATVTVQIAGAYRVSLEAEALIRRDGIVNSVVAVIVLLVVIFAVFRTPWIIVYGLIPMILAALLTFGLNGWLRGALSPATAGSAGMLFGLGIDGVVMLYLRYLEERRRGLSPEAATGRMAGTASAVILAQITTAVTFLALLILDFPSLEDLGALVGVGMLIVVAITPLLVPALLTRTRGADRGRARSAAWLGHFVTGHAGLIAVAGIVMTIGLGLASLHLKMDTRIDRLQPHTPSADLERAIAAKFSLPADVLLVINDGTNLETVLETDARLTATLAARAPGVSASGPSLLLPTAAAQSNVSTLIRAASLTSAGLAHDLNAAGVAAGFKPGTFAPFLDRVPRLLDTDARITYDGLVSHGLTPVISRFLASRDGRFVSVTYLYTPAEVDLGSLGAIVHEVDPHLRLTGLPIINQEMATRFLPEFMKGIGVGTVGVAFLLYLSFRTIRHTLLALVPTAVGFIWSAGILALTGVTLDLFSLFGAVTFLGMAVNYGVYVLYRYAVEGTRDIHDVIARTGAAIMVACSTAVIGFGSLVFSNYAPLRMFGLVSIVTLTCCLASALMLLPAMILEFQRWSKPAR